MATKLIKAWIDGAIQEIEVEDIVSGEQNPSIEDRLVELEDKPIITDGNFLVGDGTTEPEEVTPERLLELINGASVVTITQAEHDALLENQETNANHLYVITDSEENVYVQTVNSVEPDENGNIEVEIPEHTWESLPDKPFYNEQNIINWDGNTEGKDTFTLVLSDTASYNYYKLSDDIPEIDDFVGGTVTLGDETLTLTSEFFVSSTGCYYLAEPALVVVQDNEITVDGISATAPSTGIYFMNTDGMYVTNLTYSSVKTIDDDCISDNIARVEDIPEIPACSTADNGKFLRVVDGVATWVTVPSAEDGEY